MDSPADYETLKRLIERYRNRSRDLGWFMKCLNEPMARQANNEDGFTGQSILVNQLPHWLAAKVTVQETLTFN